MRTRGPFGDEPRQRNAALGIECLWYLRMITFPKTKNHCPDVERSLYPVSIYAPSTIYPRSPGVGITCLIPDCSFVCSFFRYCYCLKEHRNAGSALPKKYVKFYSGRVGGFFFDLPNPRKGNLNINLWQCMRVEIIELVTIKTLYNPAFIRYMYIFV